MENAVRIVLAEDHAAMRLGTRHILEQAGLQVVGETGDGREALELLKRLQPDVAVLDVRMPGLNGIEVLRQMKGFCPNTRVLILTAYDDDDYVLATMEAGATGYLLKSANAKELADAVYTVSQGEPVLHPAIAAKVARLWARQGGIRDHASLPLTPRELQVLELASRGLRNKAIADEMKISIRTVEGHFKSIFDKLGLSSRMEAVLYAVSRRLVKLEAGPGKGA
jgi:DNA-binding NarL/FixJ family response regulator